MQVCLHCNATCRSTSSRSSRQIYASRIDSRKAGCGTVGLLQDNCIGDMMIAAANLWACLQVVTLHLSNSLNCRAAAGPAGAAGASCWLHGGLYLQLSVLAPALLLYIASCSAVAIQQLCSCIK